MSNPIPKDAPHSVRIAIAALSSSVLINVVEVLFSYVAPTWFPIIAAGGIVGLVAPVLNAFILWMIIQRRNWARVLFAVVYVLGMLSEGVVMPTFVKQASSLELVILVLQMLLQGWTAFLLIKSPAKEYFKRNKLDQPLPDPAEPPK